MKSYNNIYIIKVIPDPIMIKLFFIFLIAINSLCANAESNLQNCKGFWDRLAGPNPSNWTNCFSEFTYDDGRYYNGEWQQGKKSGQGTFVWPDGNKYVGQFQNDVRWGSGTMYYSQGGSYTGDWKNDVREGFGTINTQNGDLINYTGQWAADVYFGTGTATLRDGTKLEGRFDNAAGNGTISYQNRDKYLGKWDGNWKRSGQGKMFYINGATYAGEWAVGLKQGYGTYNWSTGKSYSGYWDNDKKSGQGIITLPNGEKYSGEFSNDNYNGKGTYIWKSGQKYTGEWSDGKFNGRGILSFSNKAKTQDGYWENNNFIGTAEQIRQREQAQRDAEAAKKALDCVGYKFAKFTCASAGSVDACLTIRFGSDYMLYEWKCN